MNKNSNKSKRKLVNVQVLESKKSTPNIPESVIALAKKRQSDNVTPEPKKKVKLAKNKD